MRATLAFNGLDISGHLQPILKAFIRYAAYFAAQKQ